MMDHTRMIYLPMLLALVALLLFSCKREENTLLPHSIAVENHRITSDATNAIFLTDYGWEHLDWHDVYYDGKNIQAEFYFKEGAKDWETDAVWKFAHEKFVLRVYDNFKPGDYDRFVSDHLDRNPIQQLTIAVFVGGKLTLHDVLDGDTHTNEPDANAHENDAA